MSLTTVSERLLLVDSAVGDEGKNFGDDGGSDLGPGDGGGVRKSGLLYQDADIKNKYLSKRAVSAMICYYCEI